MTDRLGRPGIAVATLTLTAVLMATAGCSGSNDSDSSAPQDEASSTTPSSTTTATPSGSASSDPTSSDPGPTVASGDVLASKTFTVTGTYSQTPVRMRLDITELKRRGDLLQLTTVLTNTERDRSQDLRWQVASRFAGEYRNDLTTSSGTFSGAVLTDIAAKKRYLVAADSGKSCVCTVQLSSTFVGAGQDVELSATYAAPPTTTTKLDVTIPTLGTFRDLPIT